MKKLKLHLVTWFALFSSLSASACDLSGFTLNNVTALGNNRYKIDITFCAGNGVNNFRYGADQSTRLFAFYFSMNAKYDGVSHDTIISPITGNVFYAVHFIDSSYGFKPYKVNTLHYIDTPHYGRATWACISPSCGAVQAVCKSVSLYTIGLPDTVWLRGMEGAGNIAGGCQNLMVFPKCFGAFPSLSLGGNQTVYLSGSPNCATLTASASGGAGSYTYLWSTGASASSITVCPTVSTIYSCNIKDANGCGAKSSVTVSTSCARSSLTANAGTDKFIYDGYTATCATISGTATGGYGTKTYKWSNNVTTASQSVCPTVTTSYKLYVTDQYNCKDTDEVIVNYKNIKCGTGKVYVCYNNKSKCITTSQVNSYLNSGASLGMCGSTPAPLVAASENSIEIQLFPNPAKNELNLRLDGKAGKIKYEILDVIGKVVASKTIEEQNETISEKIDLTRMLSGIYLVKILNSEGNIIKQVKVVKE